MFKMKQVLIDINWSYFLHIRSSSEVLLSIIMKCNCWLIFLSYSSHAFIYYIFSCWFILLFFLIFLANLFYYFILFSLLTHLIIFSHSSCILWNSIKYHSLQISCFVLKWFLQTKIHWQFRERYLLASKIHKFQKLKNHTKTY